MRPSIVFLSGLITISPTVLAGTDGACCKFTLHASAPFDCPAGQLEDGQIRLNGTYDTSIFCSNGQSGITDARGFGCIVTGPPETQVQCDSGKTPEKGFAISGNNTLTYHGSPKFFACPATDTEYNIYVSPNFGQLKCVPVTLTTDGCGSGPSCPSVPPSPAPSTVTITATIIGGGSTLTATETRWSTETTTETEWISSKCPTCPTSWTPTTTHCPRCNKTTSKTWTTSMGTGTGGCTKCTGGGGHWNTTSTKSKSWGYGPHPGPTAGRKY